MGCAEIRRGPGPGLGGSRPAGTRRPGPRTARRRARPDAVLAEPIVSIEVAAAEVSVVEV